MTCFRVSRSWNLPALGVLALAGGLACGGSSSSSPNQSHRWVVLVVSSPSTEFQPAAVNALVGDTVVWAWNTGSTGHNVISYGSPTFPSKGDSLGATTNIDVFDAPTSYEYVFGASGTYKYFCSTHGTSAGTGMAGQVVVAP